MFFERNVREGDLISDKHGKRIRPKINHAVECKETMIEVQQRKDDGKIWVSSNWLYHPDCYGSATGFGEEIYKTISETVGGDERSFKELIKKYEDITHVNRYWFERALDKYFKGYRLEAKGWNEGYLFAASKERRIKTQEQLSIALEAENKHFTSVLGEFIQWLRTNGLNLGEKTEGSLRRRIKKFYASYPCDIAKKWCKLLEEEDKSSQSDIYLWWGGEPNSDACYAFLTLFFEIDPKDIGKPQFDERVSINLRVMTNIADRENTFLSSYREYEPHVWNAIFS